MAFCRKSFFVACTASVSDCSCRLQHNLQKNPFAISRDSTSWGDSIELKSAWKLVMSRIVWIHLHMLFPYHLAEFMGTKEQVGSNRKKNLYNCFVYVCFVDDAFANFVESFLEI